MLLSWFMCDDARVHVEENLEESNIQWDNDFMLETRFSNQFQDDTFDVPLLECVDCDKRMAHDCMSSNVPCLREMNTR
jgi:hypothetical protein